MSGVLASFDRLPVGREGPCVVGVSKRFSGFRGNCTYALLCFAAGMLLVWFGDAIWGLGVFFVSEVLV